MKSGEKIFRQMKQNSARVVHPTRRDFREAPTPWANGKDSVDSRREEFLEVPFTIIRNFPRKVKGFDQILHRLVKKFRPIRQFHLDFSSIKWYDIVV